MSKYLILFVLLLTATITWANGKQSYENNCIGCHNYNPKKDGSMGPALAGSTRELLEAKVLRGTYPAGYKPKRDTKIMPVMAWLQADIEALAKYLEGIK